MALCSKCGMQVPDGIKFCTSCGAPMAVTATVQPVQPTVVAAPAAPQTTAVAAPQPAETREAPISTGGWFGILFLLALPALNVLLLIIWAVGGTGKVNKKNFSRAVLLWMLISLVVSVLIGLAFSFFLAGSGGIEGIKEYILNKIAEVGVQNN